MNGSERKIFPYAYDQHDFANGLRLIALPASYPHVVALYIVVQTGSRNEVEPGKSGFAHLFEHMMFRGTKNVSPSEYSSLLKFAGAASNAYTTDDYTAYHTTFSREDLDLVMRLEADRFRYLEYSEDVFRTETQAVLGEYNKGSVEPMQKLEEVMRDSAFTRHTYKHTTMGFLADIIRMPSLYEHSREFFTKYYRPEYTTLIVAGDIDSDEVRRMAERYWGDWEPGSFRVSIPVEPPPADFRKAEIPWTMPTLPWLVSGFHSAAYSDESVEAAALDVLSFIGFSQNSPLYRKLVLEDQSVDAFWASNSEHVDPYLFTIYARCKTLEAVPDVSNAIDATLSKFAETQVDEEELAAVKSHLRYRFALHLNESEAIAATVARYVALRRTPETINRLYGLYGELTPGVLQSVAQKYFRPERRTTIQLTYTGQGSAQ